MTRLTACPDADTVAARAAALIARELQRALAERGEAHLALSGGTTPGATYARLATEMPDWAGVQLWFADERCVAPDDEESNYRLARETLLDRAGIAPGQVHRMEGERGPQDGAAGYADVLRERLGELPVIDTVVLGIGPDGHVASLFPGAGTLEADPAELCLGVTDSPKPPPERLTLTLEVLRRARSCVLLATGASKADAVAAMLGEPSSHVPASLLRRERLSVIVDDAAAPAPHP
ncbi:MAG TPA: 6-phosphogluconolactonase [Solirubrobacteraceae bacterium]|nr:6-phosphogluconolactonase [Solirubrobacteraceae bacterium]